MRFSEKGGMDARTDEELAEQLQAGDKTAVNVLVDRYWTISELIALEFPITGVEAYDRQMEAIQGLLKAAHGWQRGKGTKFKTYAKMAMRRVLIDLYRERHQKRVVPSAKLLSLDAEINSGDGDTQTLASSVADPIDAFGQADDRIYAEAAASYVIKAHREVLFGLAQEFELREIAAYLGIPDDLIGPVLRFNRAVGEVFAARNDPDWIAGVNAAPIKRTNRAKTRSGGDQNAAESEKKARSKSNGGAKDFALLLSRVRKPNATAEIWNYTRNLILSHGSALTGAEVGAIVAHYFPNKRPLSDKAIAAHYSAVSKVAR